MRRNAGSASVLRIVARNDDALEIEAATSPAGRESCMERALTARTEELPHLLRAFEQQAAKGADAEDLSEAIIHLREVTRQLAPARRAPVEAPRHPDKPGRVPVWLAASLVAVVAVLLVEGALLANRSLPAPAAPGPSPVATAMAAQAGLADAPYVGLSRAQSIPTNAAAILAKFPATMPVSATGGPCVHDNAVIFSSRALATKIADPLLRADASGPGAPEANAANWNTLIFMARLLQTAERAQIGSRAAGCVAEPHS